MTNHTKAQRKANQCARITLRRARCSMTVVPGTLYCEGHPEASLRVFLKVVPDERDIAQIIVAKIYSGTFANCAEEHCG